MRKPQPETKIRTCKACGAKYEYPLKEVNASRFHCADCFRLPVAVRDTFERLNSRVAKLEKALKD